jgi:hypothetical protein
MRVRERGELPPAAEDSAPLAAPPPAGAGGYGCGGGIPVGYGDPEHGRKICPGPFLSGRRGRAGVWPSGPVGASNPAGHGRVWSHWEMVHGGLHIARCTSRPGQSWCGPPIVRRRGGGGCPRSRPLQLGDGWGLGGRSALCAGIGPLGYTIEPLPRSGGGQTEPCPRYGGQSGGP